MKEMNVGVLGATGAVGQEMLKILAERDFPVRSVRPLASARSAGKTILFKGETVPIVEAKEDAFRGLDLVLGAAENDIAKRFAPHILDAGAVFVDNSSAFRLREDVPLIVPEINPEDAKWHKGIIANPNCTTIVTLVAVAPLAAPKAFAHQIAYNVIPQIGSEQYLGYTSEEMKMQNEGRKILHLPDMKVSCTCVRVPVLRSHSVSVVLRTKEKISVDRARALIAAAPGCKLVDDLPNHVYPMPLDTSDQDLIFVGRIREDLTSDNGLNLWCCGDQVRKGAATNAVQIAELLL